MNFSKEELIRYSRHFTLPQFGQNGQKLLKKAKVLCVGAGGLGNPLALYLTAAGVGTLGIIDDDVVELSNLHRQVLYSASDAGLPKVQILQKKLRELNPNVNIIIYNKRLIKDNALEIINQYDIVADGTDNFATRYLVNDACFHLKKPNVYTSIFQFEGQCTIFTAKNAPCYRCLFPAPPPLGLIPNCAEGGVLGVLPGIMGMIQATEVIKLITKIGEPLINRLLIYDALKMNFRELPISKNPDCCLCTNNQSFDSLPYYENYSTPNICSLKKSANVDNNEISAKELKARFKSGEKIFILDVREADEYAITNMNGYLIPLSQLTKRLNELDKNQTIIVHCHSGGRSKIAVEILKKAGFKKVYNLIGGIEAWNKNKEIT